jgi:hypothetical protein
MVGWKFAVLVASMLALSGLARCQQAALPPVASAGEYDVKREGIFIGTVISYEANSASAPHGAHVALQTRSGVLDVQLGDSRLLKMNHFSIQSGDSLRVVGESLPFGSAQIFVARILAKGNQALVLRTSRGFPVPYVAPRTSDSSTSKQGVI